MNRERDCSRGKEWGRMTILSKTVLAAIGALAITRENAEKWIDELIRRGELDKSKRAEAIKEAVARAETRAKETVEKAGRTVAETVKAVAEQGLGGPFAKADELAALRGAVEKLAAEVRRLKSRLS